MNSEMRIPPAGEPAAAAWENEEGAELCAHQLFERQARRTPAAVALVYDGVRLSYDELNRRANQVAHFLIGRGVARDTLVGLCVGRSLDMVVGILAIWKAGGAYVPMDPHYPAERIGFMLGDAGVRHCLARTDGWQRLGAAGAIPNETQGILLDSDAVRQALGAYPDTDPAVQLEPHHLAYMIYTSGSTGTPKGVLVEHGSLVNLFDALGEVIAIHEFPRPYRALQNASVSFDSSVKQLIHLLHGGELHILPESHRRDPRAFLQYIEDNVIHCFDCTPSLAKLLLRNLRGGRFAGHATCVLVGGEAIDQSLWDALAALPDNRAFNVYGPTECTVDATAAAILPGQRPPTIGRALRNVECYVLDDRRVPVLEGELYIGGAGVARGYLNRPQLTAQRFIVNPFSDGSARLYRTGDRVRWLPTGDLEFLGRIDDQVKVRGFRIELGEIEQQLLLMPEIADAVVLAAGEQVEERRLVAYLVAAGNAGAGLEARVERALRAALPDYMVPSQIICCEVFPLTPSGKIDKRALLSVVPQPATAEESARPATEAERQLEAVWCQLFQREAIGIGENFFRIGGHSLLIMQLISSVRDRLGIELPVAAVFDHPTIRGLAAALDAYAGDSRPAIEAVGAAALSTVSFEEELLYRFGGYVSPPMLMTFTLDGDIDRAALSLAVRRVVQRHSVLRTRIAVSDDRIERGLRPIDELALEHVDLTGRPDAAVALAVAVDEFAYSLGPDRLCRIALFKLAADHHHFVLAMGHMVSDIWSFDLFLKELGDFYAAARAGAEAAPARLPVQYFDYGHAQRRWFTEGRFDAPLQYWLQRLEQLPPLMDIPTDRPRADVSTYLMKTVPIALPPATMAGVAALCSAVGATPYIVLLAAFNALLAHYAQRRDILVVCPASSRANSQLENLVGCFLNLLIMRNEIDGALSFESTLARVKANAVGAYNHQHLPSLLLQGGLAQRDGVFPGQLFQVCFDYNPEVRELRLPGLAVREFRAEQLDFAQERGGVAFDFIWMLRESSGGVAGRVSYNAKLFDADTVAAMVEQFIRLLSLAVAEPGRALADLAIAALPAPDQMPPHRLGG